jgi:hypothetical protein
VDKFREAFQPAGEIREIAADKETAALLERFSGDPEVQKAASEFDHAQKLEETFLKGFDGQDFTSRRLEDESSCFPISRLMPILIWMPRTSEVESVAGQGIFT